MSIFRSIALGIMFCGFTVGLIGCGNKNLIGVSNKNPNFDRDFYDLMIESFGALEIKYAVFDKQRGYMNFNTEDCEYDPDIKREVWDTCPETEVVVQKWDAQQLAFNNGIAGVAGHIMIATKGVIPESLKENGIIGHEFENERRGRSNFYLPSN